MTDAETIQMMQRCSDEIKMLRARIEVLRPKADAYEKLSIVLNLLPQQAQSYGEDLAYMLDREIRKMKEAKEGAGND